MKGGRVPPLPIVGITMGDPAGVGPELCLKAVAAPEVRAVCRPLLFGSAPLLRRVARQLDLPMPDGVVPPERFLASADAEAQGIVDCATLEADGVQPGHVDAACGRAAYACIETAIRAALRGRVAAIATAPIHKASLNRAGVAFPGHTEILAHMTGTRRFCMMLATDCIKVSLATIHVPYRAVRDLLSTDRVLEVIELTHDALHRFGIRSPRLAVLALNPHAGEQGLFGDEEQTIIRPAVERATAKGLLVEGPLPPDTAFIPSRRERTDAYVAMYHDQGLIPFKMLGFERGVNLTLGLPIVRTSVDHGTAFDIAWQGTASPQSLVEAIAWAARLSRETQVAS
jgi:4-hydroxythreonine-4-phosphate dehydrogenase